MRPRFFRFHLLLLFLACLARAEARVFVSLAGTLLEAEITAVSGDTVTLKRTDDGQTLTVNQNTLCKEDHAYIARWVAESTAPAPAPTPAPPAAPAPPMAASGGAFQKYSLAVQVQPARNDQAPLGSTERVLQVTYNFHVSNREVNRDLRGAKAVIFTLGRNATVASQLVVLQKLELDLTVRAQDKATLATTPMQLISSQEPRYGVRSLGYVIFILDPQDNVLLAESSPEGTLTDWKVLSALATFPCLVDRDFKPQPGLEVLLPYIRF